jgi:hypothetical protein
MYCLFNKNIVNSLNQKKYNMKYQLLTIVLFSSFFSYSQDQIKPIDKYISNLKEINANSDIVGTGEDLINDLNTSLFSYFGIESEYPTPLKKSLFRQSSEYKKLNDSFLKYKNELKKLKYFSFQPSSKYFENLNYDISKSGFLVYINGHQSGSNMTIFSKCFGKIIFTNLVTVFKNDGDWRNEYIYIPCNKKYGSLIESDNSSSRVYVFFKPISVVPKRINLFGMVGSIDYLNSSIERIILTYNDEIVYNKTF